MAARQPRLLQLAGRLPSAQGRPPSRLPRPPSPRHQRPVTMAATAATTTPPWPRAGPPPPQPSPPRVRLPALVPAAEPGELQGAAARSAVALACAAACRQPAAARPPFALPPLPPTLAAPKPTPAAGGSGSKKAAVKQARVHGWQGGRTSCRGAALAAWMACRLGGRRHSGGANRRPPLSAHPSLAAPCRSRRRARRRARRRRRRPRRRRRRRRK